MEVTCVVVMTTRVVVMTTRVVVMVTCVVFGLLYNNNNNVLHYMLQ